jgi:hypothetical protein
MESVTELALNSDQDGGRRAGPGTRNAGVPTYTDLMVYVRQDARSRLEQAACPIENGRSAKRMPDSQGSLASFDLMTRT